MIKAKPSDRHSDLGPSSKDWQPGSPGRDEDFTPEKDLWTLSRKGNLVKGRPGEDLQRGGRRGGDEVQPGTAHEGTSWQSRRPDPDSQDDKLDQALKDSFPASDPPEPAQPGVTGWDLTDEERKRAGGLRARSPRTRRSPLRTASPGWLWLAAAAALASFALSAARRRRPTRRAPPPQA